MTADLSLTARVDRIFAAVNTLGDSDLLAMRGVWIGGVAELRQKAWTKVRATSLDDPRAKLLEQSRDRLATWVNDLGITWAGAFNRSIVVPMGADQGNLRSNAVPAVLDAIVATIFEDVLDEDERDELLEPLRRVTEPEPGDRA